MGGGGETAFGLWAGDNGRFPVGFGLVGPRVVLTVLCCPQVSDRLMARMMRWLHLLGFGVVLSAIGRRVAMVAELE